MHSGKKDEGRENDFFLSNSAILSMLSQKSLCFFDFTTEKGMIRKKKKN